jgi:hypothetical protein
LNPRIRFVEKNTVKWIEYKQNRRTSTRWDALEVAMDFNEEVDLTS